MKNYWLKRKAIREEIEEFQIPIPECPTFPDIQFSPIDPGTIIDIPPLVFGPCIDMSNISITAEIPSEIKLTMPDFPVINLDISLMNVGDKIEASSLDIPPVITIDWPEPPQVSCVVIIRCPGTTDEEYAEFCTKHGVKS